MANVITLPPSPPPWEVIQGFVDRYQKSRDEDQQRDLQQKQLDLQRQQVEQTGQYQQGTLGVQQGDLGLRRQQQALEEKKAKADAFLKAQIQPLLDAGDTKGAAAAAQRGMAMDPDLKEGLQAWAMERAQTPLDQSNANTARFSSNQTGIAAAGGTDPNAANFTTKRATGAFMPAEGFAQQQATDLQARGGGTNAAIPKPTGNAVTDFERRATSGMTTPVQNQQAQTQITTTGMEQSGANKRTAMTVQGQKDIAAMKDTVTGDADVRKTQSGQQFADVSGYGGADKNKRIAYYRQQGIPVLANKADVDAIREIDNARLNQQKLYDMLSTKLPPDPTSRAFAQAMTNRLGAIVQADVVLAALPSWRSAAIQSLRAAAGSKGLRINQAEIKMAVENDIPKMTDTVGVALQKLKNMNMMLDSGEEATLGVKVGGQAPGGGPSPGEAWAHKHMAKP